MAYKIRNTTVQLTCDRCGANGGTRDVIDGDRQTAMQQLWANTNGWTSSSTEHHCRRCSAESR